MSVGTPLAVPLVSHTITAVNGRFRGVPIESRCNYFFSENPRFPANAPLIAFIAGRGLIGLPPIGRFVLSLESAPNHHNWGGPNSAGRDRVAPCLPARSTSERTRDDDDEMIS